MTAPYEISHADSDTITIRPIRDNPFTVTMRHIADALGEVVHAGNETGAANLAGYQFDETDLAHFMNVMREAGGITRCDKCPNRTEPNSDLCTPCAQELYDIRLEKRLDRARDFDS